MKVAKVFYIYLIYNSTNYINYVGSTNNIKTRFNSHLEAKEKDIFHKFIRDHPEVKWYIKTIYTGTNNKEKFYFERYYQRIYAPIGSFSYNSKTIKKVFQKK